MKTPRRGYALVAAAALASSMLLVGAVPVSAAAPAQSEACTEALDALEAEFGDIEADDVAEIEDAINAVDAEFDVRFSDLDAEIDALAMQAADAQALTERVRPVHESNTAALAVAEADFAAAEAARNDLEAADPPASDEELAAALAAFQAAFEKQLEASTAYYETADVLDKMPEVIFFAELAIDDLEVTREALDREYRAALQEILGGPVAEGVDTERLLNLLTTVDLDCGDVDDVSDSDDDDDDDANGGTVPAPVAKPVEARASFTG